MTKMPYYTVHKNEKYTDARTDHFIRVEDGPFAGVEFWFNALDFVESVEEDLSTPTATLKFSVEILETNDLDSVKEEEFTATMASILQDIVETMQGEG